MKIINKTLSSQVKEIILEMINNLDFMSKLPSEQKLASKLGVSRNTVREALKALENEGLIISRHGVGTFVTRYNGKENIRYNIATLDSTTKIITDHGYVPGTKSTYYDVRMASDNMSKILGSDTPIKILYIERVRTANLNPIIFVEDYIPYKDGMLEEYSNKKDDSLFSFISNYNTISFSNCSIHAVLSNERLMEKLELDEPKALLLLQQIHYSSRGIPVFYSDSYFITEKLEFNLIRRYVE
ncbi:conserved hypothetical protein [[Clostridium] ultunense Esp]|uniref:HTH gntR-type domain-containing protein n=1 Tax=[Clostridium] ultunense Esp TaxID=1288971 RepID=M1ZLZ7_9FIRM|nr:GntR family transcriptional regulator [Schnuerera ultunensis]CCQ98072.1 conserved hypothetical protein [[Clostridium] ultunense Esp]SHD76064.1 conserved protein of unknown function [[Clostridium] ultunense Esp]